MLLLRIVSLIFCLVGLVGCMIPGTYYDPFDDYVRGVRWYDRGRHDLALKYWKPLSEQGDCDAQAKYGFLYYDSKVLPLDYKRAIEWWTKAGHQGQQKAQMFLGDLYYQGKHVAIRCRNICGINRNLVTAYKWYLLAEQSAYYKGEKKYLKHILPKIRAEMADDEIEKAKKLTIVWQASPTACKPRHLL